MKLADYNLLNFIIPAALGYIAHVLLERFRRKERYRERIFEKTTEAISNIHFYIFELYNMGDDLGVEPHEHFKDDRIVRRAVVLLLDLDKEVMRNIVYLPEELCLRCRNIINTYKNSFGELTRSNSWDWDQHEAEFLNFAAEIGRAMGLCRDVSGMTYLGRNFSMIFMSPLEKAKHWIRKYRKNA